MQCHPTPTSQSARQRLYPAFLLAAAVLVYSNSLSGPFLYDDRTAIVENEHIRQLWPLAHSLGAPYQSPVAGRPLVSLSLALNHALGQLDVRGYHAVNLAIHALCSLVLFGCVRRTLRVPTLEPRFGQAADELAFASALLWVVHPLTTEVVNYVTQRTESLMALCYLLTLYASIRAAGETRRTTGTRKRRWTRWHSAAVATCALGMTAKEAMVTAPFVVVLYDACFAEAGFRRALRERRSFYLGLAASWLVLAALNVSGPRSESVRLVDAATSFNYALNQCVLLVEYVRLTFWPHPLILDYGIMRRLSIAEVLPQAAVLAGLLAATIFALWRRPPLGFLGAWFFILLSPTSSFVPILTEVGAERRLYLPLASALVLYVLLAWTLLHRGRTDSDPRDRAFVAGVLAASIGLGWLSYERNTDYQSAISIWQSSVAARPGNPRAHNNLGMALQESDPAAAAREYRKALEIDPRYVDALHNLGNSLRLLGQLDEAIPMLERALEIDPAHVDARNNLGSVLGASGRLDEAIRQFELAIQLDPRSAGAHANLGFALSLTGDFDAAMLEYQRALKILPTAETHFNLGNTLLELGRYDDAVGQLQEAARLAPRWSAPRDQLRSLGAR